MFCYIWTYWFHIRNLGIIVVIHIFKIRYLDYFITIEDENATTKSKEAAIENDDNKEKVQQLKFIDNKKNKIIIRAPKHSTYSFFGILAKILVLIIKLNLAICSIFAIITFVLLVFFQTMSIWFIRKSIFFLGTTLLLLGLLMINYLVLKFQLNKRVRQGFEDILTSIVRADSLY